MDELTRSVELYLADHNAGFTIDELCQRLSIRKTKLLLLIGELKAHGLIEVRYKADKMVIMHKGWIPRET